MRDGVEPLEVVDRHHDWCVLDQLTQGPCTARPYRRRRPPARACPAWADVSNTGPRSPSSAGRDQYARVRRLAVARPPSPQSRLADAGVAAKYDEARAGMDRTHQVPDADRPRGRDRRAGSDCCRAGCGFTLADGTGGDPMRRRHSCRRRSQLGARAHAGACGTCVRWGFSPPCSRFRRTARRRSRGCAALATKSAIPGFGRRQRACAPPRRRVPARPASAPSTARQPSPRTGPAQRARPRRVSAGFASSIERPPAREQRPGGVEPVAEYCNVSATSTSLFRPAGSPGARQRAQFAARRRRPTGERGRQPAAPADRPIPVAA